MVQLTHFSFPGHVRGRRNYIVVSYRTRRVGGARGGEFAEWTFQTVTSVSGAFPTGREVTHEGTEVGLEQMALCWWSDHTSLYVWDVIVVRTVWSVCTKRACVCVFSVCIDIVCNKNRNKKISLTHKMKSDIHMHTHVSAYLRKRLEEGRQSTKSNIWMR